MLEMCMSGVVECRIFFFLYFYFSMFSSCLSVLRVFMFVVLFPLVDGCSVLFESNCMV